MVTAEVICGERRGDVTDENSPGRGTCRGCGQEVGLRGFIDDDEGPGQFYLRAHTVVAARGGVRQEFLHDNADGIPGDCLRAAVATLFEFDLVDVPHFLRYTHPTDFDTDPDDLWWYAFHGFVATLDPPHRWVEQTIDPRHPEIPERPCVVSGRSPRGEFNHVITYFGDGQWWDPHPSDDGVLSVVAVHWAEPVGQDEEIERLLVEKDRLSLALIEARNPGIDMDEVRELGRYRG